MTQVTDEYLQAALSALRAEVLGRIDMTRDTDAAARQVLKDAFFEHVTMVEAKFENDVEDARRQVVAIKGDLAETKTRLSSVPHVPEASAHAALHLTRRKGFDGLTTYGGGVQWKDWRFSTVRWFAQEHKPFRGALAEHRAAEEGNGGAGRRVPTDDWRRSNVS